MSIDKLEVGMVQRTFATFLVLFLPIVLFSQAGFLPAPPSYSPSRSPVSLLSDADSLAHHGQLDLAIEGLQDGLRLFPNADSITLASFYYRLARLLFEKQRSDLASLYLEEAFPVLKGLGGRLLVQERGSGHGTPDASGAGESSQAYLALLDSFGHASVLKSWESALPDSGKKCLIRLYEIWGQIAFSDRSQRSKSVFFQERALRLAKGFPALQAVLLAEYGYTLRSLKRYEDAILAGGLANSALSFAATSCTDRIKVHRLLGYFYYKLSSRSGASAMKQSLAHFAAMDSLLTFCNPGYCELAWDHYYYGQVLNRSKDTQGALNQWRKGLSFGDSIPASCLSRYYLYEALGFYYYNSAKFDSCLDIYKASWMGLRDSGDPYKIQRTLSKIGNSYIKLGNHSEALPFFTRQKNLIETHRFPGYEEQLGLCLNSLSIIYKRQGDYRNAEQTYLESLQLLLRDTVVRQDPNDFLNGIATVYYNLGSLHSMRKDTFQARANFRSALIWYLRAPRPDYGRVVVSKLDLARYSIFADPDSSALLVDEALALLADKRDQLELMKVVEALRLHGFYLQSIQDYDAALARYQAAMQLLEPSLTSSDPTVNPAPREILSLSETLGLLRAKAEVFRELYRRSGQLSFLSHSLNAHRTAVALIPFIRRRRDSQGSQLELNKKNFDLYQHAIDAAWELFRVSGDRASLEDIFDFSEASKGVVLMEAISEKEWLEAAGVPESQRNQVQALRNALQKLESELNMVSDPSRRGLLSKEILATRDSLDARLHALELAYPGLAGERRASVSLSDVQARVANDSTDVLQFFLGDTSLVVMLIRPDTVLCRMSAISAGFDSALVAFHELVLSLPNSHQVSPAYLRLSSYLSGMLFGDWLPSLRPFLVLLPHGALNELSFAALAGQVPVKGGVHWSSFPYLVRSHAVSYDYSAALLMDKLDRGAAFRRRPGRLGPASILGMAPSFRRLSGLDGARDWVGQLEQLFVGAEVYFDTAATKSIFMRRAVGKLILDLATHAIPDTARPLWSHLIFAGPEGRDDSLFLYELYGMDLQAELAILEACETGRGKLMRGEGVISLARGFSFAGCRSILMTLWEADDASTSALISGFYMALAERADKASALKSAVGGYLDGLMAGGARDWRRGHPFYWAGLVLAGDPEPVDLVLRSGGVAWWLIVVLVFGVLGLVVLGFRVWG